MTSFLGPEAIVITLTLQLTSQRTRFTSKAKASKKITVIQKFLIERSLGKNLCTFEPNL